MNYESIAALKILENTGLSKNVLRAFARASQLSSKSDAAIKTAKKLGFSAKGLDLMGRVLELEKTSDIDRLILICGTPNDDDPGKECFVDINIKVKRYFDDKTAFLNYLGRHHIPTRNVARHDHIMHRDAYDINQHRGFPATVTFYPTYVCS
ncbi:MAG: hypothetical protein AAB649_05440 [Patescibacteria group bacterium]